MKRANPFFTSSLCAALSLGLFACDGPLPPPSGEIDPTGTDHTFVISSIHLPTNPSETTSLALDIDGKANDGVDNQLGQFLASVHSLDSSLDLQTPITTQIDQGANLMLINVKAKSLTDAAGVGMWLYTGADANPPACNDANDAICRHHLDGSGSFHVDPSSSTDDKIAGRIVGGTFTGGPGNLTVKLALPDGAPLSVPLQRAFAELSGVSDGGFNAGKIGGAISQADFDGTIIPAVALGIRTAFTADCAMPTAADCGCAAGSDGAAKRDLFDNAPTKDCMISDAEVRSVINSLLTPDIDLSGDGVNDAISLGFGVQGVRATFTVPHP